MASKIVFLLPYKTMVRIIQSGLTEVEYSYHRPLSIGDEVLLREYAMNKTSEELMYMNCTIKSIESISTHKNNPNRKKYGINIQLIMF